MFAVIVNPVSGGGEAARLAIHVSERIAELGQESRLFETGGEGDAARQIRSAVEAGYSSVVCIGGDGTLCEAVDELCYQNVTLYVVPGGTGNDFARAFGLPKDPLAAFERQLAGTPVLASDLGGTPELLIQGVTGDLFEAGNAEELAEKIRELWENEEKLLSLRDGCFALSEGKLSLKFDDIRQYCRKLLLIYQGKTGEYLKEE